MSAAPWGGGVGLDSLPCKMGIKHTSLSCFYVAGIKWDNMERVVSVPNTHQVPRKWHTIIVAVSYLQPPIYFWSQRWFGDLVPPRAPQAVTATSLTLHHAGVTMTGAHGCPTSSSVTSLNECRLLCKKGDVHTPELTSTKEAWQPERGKFQLFHNEYEIICFKVPSCCVQRGEYTDSAPQIP